MHYNKKSGQPRIVAFPVSMSIYFRHLKLKEEFYSEHELYTDSPYCLEVEHRNLQPKPEFVLSIIKIKRDANKLNIIEK